MLSATAPAAGSACFKRKAAPSLRTKKKPRHRAGANWTHKGGDKGAALWVRAGHRGTSVGVLAAALTEGHGQSTPRLNGPYNSSGIPTGRLGVNLNS